MKTSSLIQIGEIYREHGLNGEVKVYLYNPDSESFIEGMEVWLKKDRGDYQLTKILALRPFQKWWLTQFSIIHDSCQAQEWRKAGIYLEKESLPKIKKGEYYFFDLMGYQVMDQHDRVIGTLKGLQGSGDSALYILEGCEKREILIPAVAKWILKVDKKAKKIVMELPEGLC